MSKLVTDFKALTLSQQHETYPAITAAYNAAKDARRVELEAEIKLLGFKNWRSEEVAHSGRKVSLKERPEQDVGRSRRNRFLAQN